MKKKIKTVTQVCVTLLSVVFLLTGCRPDLSSDLPVETFEWKEDGEGFIQFYTNDVQYVGYSFSKLVYTETPLTTYTVEVKKITGASSAGYGVVFCVEDWDNYYRLLITINKRFSVRKKVADAWTTLIDWQDSSNLGGVYNQVDTIQITRNGTTNTFTIYFNGIESGAFTDSSFSGGGCGFRHYVSKQNEDFPNTPSDVRYRQTAPVVWPE